MKKTLLTYLMAFWEILTRHVVFGIRTGMNGLKTLSSSPKYTAIAATGEIIINQFCGEVRS